jgi:hypothetical protein
MREITKSIINDQSSLAGERQDHADQWGWRQVRGPEGSATCQPNRHSTAHDLHWLRLFINSLKIRGGAVWALITIAFLKFQRFNLS